LINKLILVPAALAIGAFAPWGVTPLLMVGGAFLCYEGFEKLAHKFTHSKAEQAAAHDALLKALADPSVDIRQVEKDKIKGAVRTDFILSAEIIAITLGTVQANPFITQLAVLTSIALVMTVGVYGLVAGIVKLDDGGLHLSQRPGPDGWSRFQRGVGGAILLTAPWLMKFLSIAGTAAMFLVGGGILTHGLTPLHHAVDVAVQWGTEVNRLLGAVMPLLVDAGVGVVAGALVLLAVGLFRRLKPSP